jgi:hypothetical protein
MSGSIQTIVQEVETLSLDDQIMVNTLLTQKIREEKRLIIRKEADEALQNYRDGRTVSGTADDILAYLHDPSINDDVDE